MAGQVWSTSSVGGYLSSQKLSKVLRDAVKETVKFRQFAGVKDASMQGTGKGQTFTWDVLNEIDGTQGVIAENQVVPEGNFTIAQGTLTVDEYAFAVPYTQKLDKFSEFPITNMIQRKLKNHTARSLDVLAHAQFDTTQLKVYPTGGTSTTGVTLSTTGTVGGTASVAYGNGHAKAIIDIMKERNIPPYIGDDYFAISWPTTLRTFKNNLELIHQYTSEGFKMIATGEIGRYENCRYVEQTHVAKDATTSTDWIFFFGDDTVMEGINTPEEIRGKLGTDYGRDKGFAWYYLGGFGLVRTQVADQRVIKWESLA